MEHPSAERLPVTEQEQPESYEKDKGSAQIHGQIFEYKFCALVYLRAKNKEFKFKLASNMKGVGAFDDVVLEYFDANSRNTHIFVQLKSKTKQRITKQQLLAEKGDFSLRKYYNSYLEAEENFICSEEEDKMEGRMDKNLFILYTNTEVPSDLESNKVTDVGEEFLMTGGKVLQFNEQEHKAIYQNLQDLPKHREFLSRFRIFYSQADENGMDRYIKQELQQYTKIPDSELDLTYEFFLPFIQNWWKNCNYFLKDNCIDNDLLKMTSEKVTTTLVTKFLRQRKSELDDLIIKYKESAITDTKQLIEPNRAVLIFAPGRSTTLTAAKIHQMLGATEHSILNLQQFMRYMDEVLLAWQCSFDVLVLESQKSTENFQDVADKISKILYDSAEEKKFIFISRRDCNTEQIGALRSTLSTTLTEQYDEWKFSDIFTESTTFLLEKKVIFQGTELQIKDLVKESDFRMLSVLDCDSMTLMLANEKPAIGTSTENLLEYYIDRTLECYTNVKSCIQNKSEIKVPFREESLEELQGTKKKCNSRDQGQGFSSIFLENEKEKEAKRQYTQKNTLKNLCTKDQTFLSRQKSEDILTVQRGPQNKSTTVWRPSTFIDVEDRIVLVTDEPGMGKSTLLTHLANQTRELNHNMWIVRVNINNYTRKLDAIKTNGFEENVAMELLTEAAKIKEMEGAQLERQLFNYIYNSTGNMAVLIDGVDEVSPHYTEEILQILRILSKTKIRKLWITSRNSVKDQLEQELQCQSYRLVPFSAEDQKSFLVKFWNQKFSHIETGYLESLARRVVELCSKHLSVREKSFMGVPLQSLLLAEMFEENLTRSTSEAVQLPEHINFFMLYKFYMKKKWNIYLSEKKLSDRTNVNAAIDDDALYELFRDNHQAAALMTILSAKHLEELTDKNVLKRGSDFVQKINQGLEKTGIITDIIEGRPVFLHRTLAEYLVASWLCDNNSVSQIFIRDHLFEPEFGVVRSMVDRILADNYPLHEAVINSDVQHVETLLQMKESVTEKDGGGRTPLHVAVSCSSPELTGLLLEYAADVSSVDTLLGWSPIDYASRMVDWQMLSLLMEKRPNTREQVLNEMNPGSTEYIPSALRAAARYEHTDLLRYLISKWNCVNMVLPGDSGTLLHEAARDNHIQTVRTLFDLGAGCDIQDSNGKTALHVSAEAGNFEVAKFIVERQEMSDGEAEMKEIETLDRTITKLNRLNVRDNEQNTPLHLAAAAGNTSTVCYLLSAGSDVKSCNTRGEYPLTLAARYGRNDTVNVLLQSFCAVNCEEIMTSALTAAIVAGQVDTTAFLLRSGAPVSVGENEKPIHIASRLGYKEIVSLLVQNGAGLTSCTDGGNTALHLASEAGHMNLVKYLVELRRDGLYSLNYENETPLHLAARNERDYLVSYFAENGCNINSTSANGATCLHVACEKGHYTTAKCLLKHGAEVNAMNSADQTPLHIAASLGKTKIVELLLQHKANISLRDKDGFTALLAASINGHQDTVRFIVQHGGNMEDRDGKGNRIAHFAVENDNYDILNLLLQRNVNLDVQNLEGESPLFKAVCEGRNRMVQYLMDNNSDVNSQSKVGLRPLDVAVLNDNMEIARLLLERNARSCKMGIHMVAAARFGFMELLQRFVAMGDDIKLMADNGETPLHAACKSGQVATVRYLCEHGAKVELQDKNGYTALHVAVSNGHLNAARFLVEKDANLCAADASGSTALHIAAKGGHVNTVQYLADSFAPIDKRNAKNESSLLVAAREGHEKVVRVLIEQGAGIGVRDIEGKTALDIATEKGYGAITQILKDRAEGRIIVCSNSHIVPRTDSAVNAEDLIDKATQNNGADTARMIKTRTEATLEISKHRCDLHTAVENGSFEEVERLVQCGIAVDYGDTFGRTALWLAASRGDKPSTRLLLANGSCVNIPDCEGMSPICAAAMKGHWDVVEEFLEHGPKFRSEGTEYLKSMLYEATESEYLEVVRIILKCGISVNTTDKHGYTPLHVAANSEKIEISKMLLLSGAKINIRDHRGKTPLIIASEKGHVEIVRNLLSAIADCNDIKPVSSAGISGEVEVERAVLKYGASVDTHIDGCLSSVTAEAPNKGFQMVPRGLNDCEMVDIADENGCTSLYVAAQNGHVEIVRQLLKYDAKVESSNKNVWTPINTAAYEGHLEVVRELLKHGAKVETASNNGWTPLNSAAHRGHKDVVRELLKHDAKIETENTFGFTALYSAAAKGYLDIVRELLKHDAKMEIENIFGFTALNSAAAKSHLDVVRELLKHGAKLETSNNNGWTPLKSAADKGHVDVVRELLKHGAKVESASNEGWTPLISAANKGYVDVVQELLKYGAKVESASNEGWTPLNSAANKGHVDIVRELLKHGAEIETANNNGFKALQSAANSGNVDVVRELLKHGAKVESSNNEGWTPLNSAANKGHVNVVRELLKHGAETETSNNSGYTPLHSAANSGNVEVVRELLKNGAKVESASNEGWTSLNSAADKGHVDVVQELLKHGAEIETGNKNGFTPLHLATNKGHVDVVQEMLKHGAKVETKCINGWTPLNSASESGHIDIVRELLKYGAKLETASNNGSTPLYSAVNKGHVDVVRELLKHGVEMEKGNKNGFTPLHSAADKGLGDVVRELLKHGADLETANNSGWTPLHSAATKGHVDVVRELLKHGAQLETSNNSGWTPLKSAATKGHVDVVRELLKHGAQLETSNNSVWTPLKSAAEEGHTDVVRELLEHGAKAESASNDGWTSLNSAANKGHVGVVRELLKHGAEVETTSNDGWTPLNSAADNGHLHVVRELLKRGSKMETANNNGWTPLNSAAGKGHEDVVRELLKHGAEVETANNYGWTPLNSAADEGHLHVVQELLKHGGKVESKNINGRTPLNSAAKSGHLDVVRELLKHGAEMETANNNGWTPLNSAAESGQLDVVQELLKFDAKLEVANNNGYTPLNSAADNGQAHVVRELLKHGAKVETKSIYGWTPLNAAADGGHLDVVLELLKHGAKVENSTNRGWTPLKSAADEGHLDVVRELLKHGANIESVSNEGWTPLNSAANKGQVEVVRELLKHGAKVETKSINGWTPLNSAADSGHLDIVRELLKYGANLETANEDVSTPLNSAANEGHVDVVLELLKHGAELETANINGMTPLNSAAFRGHVDVVRQLLKRGAKLDTANKKGWTPLKSAKEKHHVSVVRELLKHGATT